MLLFLYLVYWAIFSSSAVLQNETDSRIRPALSCESGNTLQVGLGSEILRFFHSFCNQLASCRCLRIVSSVVSWGGDLATVKLVRLFRDMGGSRVVAP